MFLLPANGVATWLEVSSLVQKSTSATVRALLLMALLTAPLGYGQPASVPLAADGPLSYPVAARLELPGEAVASGNLARLRVVVRNTSSEAAQHGVAAPLQAVVIRDVHWAGYPEAERLWIGPAVGSTRVNSDGIVYHNPNAQRLTEVSFERGLLLPGEEIAIDLPMTPQASSLELSVSYAVVGAGADFTQEVLLPWPMSKVGPGIETKYGPPTEAALQLRAKEVRLAVVKATLHDPQAELGIRNSNFTFHLPLLTTTSLTAGLSPAQARARSHMPADALAFYRGALDAWIVVSKDGSTVALYREAGSWKKSELVRMDPTAPELFCSEENGVTRITAPAREQDGKLVRKTRTLTPGALLMLLSNADKKRFRLVRTTVNEMGNRSAVLDLRPTGEDKREPSSPAEKPTR